jgi:hypothetical protein
MRNGPNERSLPDAHPADRKIHAGPIHAQKNLNGVGTMLRPVEGDRCDHAARTDTPRRRQENPLDKKSSTNLQRRLFPKRRRAFYLACVTLVKPKIVRDEIAQLSHHPMIIENFRSPGVIFGDEIGRSIQLSAWQSRGDADANQGRCPILRQPL